MRVPTRARQLGVALNLTPLIDIVFLLVIFFLVASHAARTESTEPIELPAGGEVEDGQVERPRRLIVTVTNDQALQVRIEGEASPGPLNGKPKGEKDKRGKGGKGKPKRK